MLCFVALIIFLILGIFSLTHRQLAKEAFDCVFKNITLRPCDTGFDEKIKSQVLGKLINKSPQLAKNINRFWKPLSWILTILFFISLFFSAQAIYNLIKYQTCNPANPESCILGEEGCSPSSHCEPCECGEDKSECTFPDYTVCGGKENCDCDTSCKIENPE